MPPKFSDADLDGLTEEERDGLLDETVVDQGLESAGGDEAGDDVESDAGEGAVDDGADDNADDKAGADSDDKAAGDDTAVGDTGDTGADAGEAGADDDVAAGEDEEEEKPASWILPADINDKIKTLDEERDRIVASFDDGDLTAKEMREKMRPIEQQLDELKDLRTTATVTKNIAIETYKTQTVPAFFKDHPQYKPGTVLHSMLDTELRKLQSASKDPLNPKHLQKAHAVLDEQLRAALGQPVQKKADNPAGKDTGKPPKREVPPTLANVPAADISDTDDGGEFAYLDRLANKDIEAYERELGRLSDEKRDRYLAQ
ncbi:hypothetical protein [Sinorhizobium chiapasense]|uniref:Scaffolding protein n=1 Tax=Sinorhizobium chiapasense TaxID=501572 RepID=A0ABZ2BAT8_9HYPH